MAVKGERIDKAERQENAIPIASCFQDPHRSLQDYRNHSRDPLSVV